MTNIKPLFFLLPLLVMACTLTAPSAANVAMSLPEQIQTAEPTPSASAPTFTPAPRVCEVKTGIESGALNLRACGGMDCPVLIVLREGETLTQTHRVEPVETETQPVNGWMEVITAGGLRGWVNSNYTDCEEQNE
ncbi:SH3 domain-containing protein [Chloroflexi bacterium CFX6]|nr:SH3 domain-containing protein [Chloroflexi bacterium CFX6]